jgi:hypothetical protein
MTHYKDIWKTATLAAAVTILFAVLVFGLDNWLDPSGEDLVADDEGGNDSIVTRIISQIAVGSYDGGITKYTTVIQIINPAASGISVSGDFYNQDGSGSTISMKLRAGDIVLGAFTGSLAPTKLPGNSSLTITVDDPTMAAVNWGKIIASGNTSVSSFFEHRDAATEALYARVGVESSPGNLTRFVIPWVRNAATGLDVGFALVNTGSIPAEITVRATVGENVVAARTYSAAARSQVTTFANQFLAPGSGCSPCLEVPTGITHGFLQFEAGVPAFASQAIAIENGRLSGVPIEVLQ